MIPGYMDHELFRAFESWEFRKRIVCTTTSNVSFMPRPTIQPVVIKGTSSLCVLFFFFFLRWCTKNFTKTPSRSFFSEVIFQHEPENRFWCLLHRPISKTLIMELSYMVFKYFVLISNNNTMNPTFSPVRTRLDICKFTCYFVTRKYKTL